ncbi:hypothetical protein ACGFZP_24280 [Kitasatospora sp. NPDC048239]|uniref:hypothetical protein n=1 Tax=Kitasatospora sp. NPDC048239 TaxID=3364046 RepID=UPI00372471AF
MTTQAGTGTPRRPDAEPRSEHLPAPWVRTRLRSSRPAVLLMAALAFGTVFLAAAFPRALDRGTDSALRDYLHSRGPAWTSVLFTAGHKYEPKDLDRLVGKFTSHPNETFRFADDKSVYGTRGNSLRTLFNTGLARPDEVPPRLGLLYLKGVTEHTSLVAGNWPTVGNDAEPVQIAISRSAADTIGIHLGQVLDAGSTLNDEPVQAKVVGLYAAIDPGDQYWLNLNCPEAACLMGAGKRYWATAGIIDPGAVPRLDRWGTGSTDFWRLPVDVDELRADQLSQTSAEISSYVAGSTGIHLIQDSGRPDLQLSSQLPQLFDRAVARQEATAPLSAIGPAGLAGVAGVVLCLAAALTFDRRGGELRLLQARGGSRGGVLLRLLGEGALTVLPAAAVATALALLLLPTARWSGAVLAALATTLLALLGFPARAVLLWSAQRPPSRRRRLVGELAVLAITGAAVLEVRRRGIAPSGEGLDPILVAAPLLLALSGGLLLARIQPVVVGALARATGRGSGLVGFLGLARAARGTGGRPRPSILPLLALMLAVTTAGFGATVLDAVDGARIHAARDEIGADASVVAPVGFALEPGLTAAADALPGVRTSSKVWWESEVFLLGTNNGSARVHLLAVDPQSYAELSRTVGRGEFDPAALAGGEGGIDTPMPALFSAEVAKAVGSGEYRLRMPNGREILATKTGSVDGTPALEAETRRFIILPIGPASARLPQMGRPNLWFAAGDVNEQQLRKVVRDSGPGGAASGQASAPAAVPAPATTQAASPAPASAAATKGVTADEPDGLPTGYAVRTSSARSAELADDPLQAAAGRLFWAAVIGAAGFALLAVLLTLLRAAPERVAMLARLRTMGLRPRQGLALIVAETLPQTLVAAVGGGLTAIAAVALLGPAFDLSALVGAPVKGGLQPAVVPVLIQVLGLSALVCAGVLAEALISGRRQITTELRVGDQR